MMGLGRVRRAACLAALAVLPALAVAEAQPTAATVVSVNPAVSRARAGAAPQAVSLGMQMLEGDSLRTDSHGGLRLVLADGSLFAVLPNSEVSFDKLGPQGAGGSVFKLLKGILQASVKRLKGNERQLVVTSNGVAGVKGTEYQVSAEGGRMELKVLSGVVELKDPAGKGAVSVPAGHAAISRFGFLPGATHPKFNLL